MLDLAYKPVHGVIDSDCWPASKYIPVDIPDYRINRPLDYYDVWPEYYHVWTPLKPFRRYLNNLLLRDLRLILCDLAVEGYTKVQNEVRNFLSLIGSGSGGLVQWCHGEPGFVLLCTLQQTSHTIRMIYLDYPIKGVDYPYYPLSTRHYRPLSVYYNYYYPLRSLNSYSWEWPNYPYYRYLYYKYTLPSDRYYWLTKSRMIFVSSPISGSNEYRVYPTASYLRHKVYKPLGLYCDYYEPIRSLYWNSSYWPLYRTAGSFYDDLPSHRALRLQRIFDDETRLIRAQTSSLLRKIHDPVPRVRLSWPAAKTIRYDDGLPARFSSDNSIHRMLITSPRNEKVQYTTYYTEPVRKYIGPSHLSCVTYAGGRPYDRRPYVYMYENPLQSDIQLLSYYINKFRKEKAGVSPPDSSKVPLSPLRPSRKWDGAKKETDSTSDEMKELREARAARLAFIHEEERTERTKKEPEATTASKEVDEALRAKKQRETEQRLAEEARLAQEKAQADEQARIEAEHKKKEEAARKAELARQEELAAQAAAERAAELERQAELTRQKELEKQAEIERKKQQEEERARQEEQRRLEEEAKAEEERQQLLRLEELAKQAEEEQEAELARQAEELAELARQEAELEEQRKIEAEEAEKLRQEAELEELRKQEEELAELERQEAELAQQAEEARQEAEAAQKAQEEAEAARKAEELAQQEAELAELERQQAELDALDAEAKALEEETAAPTEEIQEEEAVQEEEVQEEEEPVPEEPEQSQEVLEEEEEEVPEKRFEDPVKQAAFEEFKKDFEELQDLQRAQIELDALEAEAKALEADLGSPLEDGEDEEPQAIAEDVPGVQSDEEIFEED